MAFRARRRPIFTAIARWRSIRETGKLKWYYQHLPADDWDTDHTHERTLVTTTFNPDPKAVKWYNTEVPRGSKHDVAAMVGESGIMFVLDRNDGKFLWAEPVPVDAPNLAISNIDGKTGATTINYDVVMKKPGDHHVICYWNGRSYWPTAYDPETNSLYTGYVDNCLDMTGDLDAVEIRHGVLARRLRHQRNRRPRQNQSFHRRDAEVRRPERARHRRAAGHRRRIDLPRGHQPQIPRIRRRHRQATLGIDSRRADLREHRHVRGRRASSTSW